MRRILRVGAFAAVGAIAVLAVAGPAAAHVTVDPSQAPRGEEATIVFRVPTESNTLSTTKVDVFLPTDQPIAEVLTTPLPGWTASTKKTRLAKPIATDDGDQVSEVVSEVTWTANNKDAAIKPGQFLDFPLYLGPLPSAVDQLEFKTLQTYSDGSVVRWIDSTTGNTEPEHPVPVLLLSEDDNQAPTTVVGSDRTVGASSKNPSSDTLTVLVTIAACAFGLVGATLGALSYLRWRSPAP
jgi:uncharacterized protein YcnI